MKNVSEEMGEFIYEILLILKKEVVLESKLDRPNLFEGFRR